MNPEVLRYAVMVGDEVARCFVREVTEASAEAVGSIDNAFILTAAMETIGALVGVLGVSGIIPERFVAEVAR